MKISIVMLALISTFSSFTTLAERCVFNSKSGMEWTTCQRGGKAGGQYPCKVMSKEKSDGAGDFETCVQFGVELCKKFKTDGKAKLGPAFGSKVKAYISFENGCEATEF